MNQKKMEQANQINACDRDGSTPLIKEEHIPPLLALKEKKTEMAVLLINKGANIHVIDDIHRNILMYAVRCESEDLIKLLEKSIDFEFRCP